MLMIKTLRDSVSHIVRMEFLNITFLSIVLEALRRNLVARYYH